MSAFCGSSLNRFAFVGKINPPHSGEQIFFCLGGREVGIKLLSSARKLPGADRDPKESAEEAGDGAPHPSHALG